LQAVEQEGTSPTPEQSLASISASPMLTDGATQPSQIGDARLIKRAIYNDKSFLLITNRFIGRGRSFEEVVDTLCIFYGANTPNIIRYNENRHTSIDDHFIPENMKANALGWNIEPV
jgi:hypothetical protein